MLSDHIKQYFDKAIDIVFSIILVLIIIGIFTGGMQLLVSTWKLFYFSGITGPYIGFISDILTLYVLIELSRSLINYFHHSKLQVTYILDACFVFVMREVLISLFKHEMEPQMLYALSAFILTLCVARISTSYFQPSRE